MVWYGNARGASCCGLLMRGCFFLIFRVVKFSMIAHTYTCTSGLISMFMPHALRCPILFYPSYGVMFTHVCIVVSCEVVVKSFFRGQCLFCDSGVKAPTVLL